MGVQCVCSNSTKDKEVRFLNTNRKKILIDQISNLSQNFEKIILIQSIFRGYFYRKNKEIHEKNEQFPTLKYNSLNNININYLFKNYPLLPNFFVESEIELKPPFEFSNKREMYYGEWHKETRERHGRGIQQWLDGSRYEGYWLNGKTNIKGKLFHSNGDIYDGEWFNDKAHGHGIYKKAKGGQYEGEWKMDQRHGKGKEIWADGSCYEGDYVYGRRQGSGRFKFVEGSEYEGSFFEDMLHGKGKYTWNDKREYIGEWAYNQMNGFGLFKWPDGRRYEGEYKKDKKDGFGTF